MLAVLADSALSGLAHSIGQLVAFRAIQGLGVGGLMVGAIVTLGDLPGGALLYLAATLHQPRRTVKHKIDHPGTALLAQGATRSCC